MALDNLDKKLTDVVDAIQQERAERRRSTRIIAIVIAVGVFLVGLDLTQGVIERRDDARRSVEAARQRNRIESAAIDARNSARDANQVAVQFSCAIELAREHPEFAPPGQQPGEIETFDACVNEALSGEP